MQFNGSLIKFYARELSILPACPASLKNLREAHNEILRVVHFTYGILLQV